MKENTMKCRIDKSKYNYLNNINQTLGRKSTLQKQIKRLQLKILMCENELNDIVLPSIKDFQDLKNINPTVFKKKMGNHTYWVGKVYWYKKKLKDPVKGTGFYTKDWNWFQIGRVEKFEGKSMDELRDICKKKFYDKLKK
ncbi:hypothetical protein EB821_04935 [Candidatus Marinimicrobia bacterium PRS2]|mgnify:CR=1 FL=1|nr:hypothetical protein EB821_04935 [Candidatus Marinimicrobia bacterium PRS2]